MADILHNWQQMMHQNTSGLPVKKDKKGKQNFNNNATEVSVPTLDFMWKDRCPPTAICFFMTLKWLNRQMRSPALWTRKLKSTSSHVNLERKNHSRSEECSSSHTDKYKHSEPLSSTTERTGIKHADPLPVPISQGKGIQLSTNKPG